MNLYPKTGKGLAFSILRIAAGVYVLVLAILLFAQERLIFFPSSLPSDFNFQLRHPVEEKLLEVDGIKIHSLLFQVEEAKGLMLYFHGNAGSMETWGEVAQQIAFETKMSVWIIDYPGFGKSEGRISSEDQLHKIAATFMEAAIALEGKASQIVIYGRSIGSGIAVKLAAEYKPGALILESPYYSLENLAQEVYPWAPLFLLKYKFRSDLLLPRITCPVLVVHGEQDEVIPFLQGKKLAELATDKTFTAIPQGHHNDLSSFPEYWDSLKAFLSYWNKMTSADAVTL